MLSTVKNQAYVKHITDPVHTDPSHPNLGSDVTKCVFHILLEKEYYLKLFS